MRPNTDRSSRRGLASVAVLIALFIIALICAGLLKLGMARRSEVGSDERLLQAEWLTDAGLGRASATLARDGDYRGETWEVPAGDLGGRGLATVAIRVEPIADRPDARRVRAQADYPAGSVLRARRSKETVVEISSKPR